MEINELTQQFLRYLRLEKHLSEPTARYYHADLKQFCVFLLSGKIQKIDKKQAAILKKTPQPPATIEIQQQTEQLLITVDTPRIEFYLQNLEDSQYSRITINRKLAALRCFYRFLIIKKLVGTNPVDFVKVPKQKKGPPMTLSYEQIQRLLDTPPSDNWLGARDRAILHLLYSSGMLASELVKLKKEDIDLVARVVQIRGRNGDKRTLTIAQSALMAIERYLILVEKQRRHDKQASGTILFPNRYGGPLSTRSIRRKLDKYLKTADLNPSVTPHTLRHSFVQHMLQNGSDLRQVRQLLGHRSHSSTQIYVGMTQNTK